MCHLHGRLNKIGPVRHNGCHPHYSFKFDNYAQTSHPLAVFDVLFQRPDGVADAGIDARRQTTPRMAGNVRPPVESPRRS
jgi:hypothetical protein